VPAGGAGSLPIGEKDAQTPGVWIQSHVAANNGEIPWTRKFLALCREVEFVVLNPQAQRLLARQAAQAASLTGLLFSMVVARRRPAD
jgi:hypothetical protein